MLGTLLIEMAIIKIILHLLILCAKNITERNYVESIF